MIEKERIRRRDLPHWEVPGATYFITSCLEGSIPAQGMLDIARYSKRLERQPRPQSKSTKQWDIDKGKMKFARIDRWLDSRPAKKVLENPAMAQIVVDSMFHHAGIRYDLISFVVMPSHFHWLFRPMPAWVDSLEDDNRSPRERIMYSLKRFTATNCNRALGIKGQFWQEESYDHWVRDVDEMARIIQYIEENPVKAGLVEYVEDWPFSSAQVRKIFSVEFGSPLIATWRQDSDPAE